MGERPEAAGVLAPLSSPSPARGCGGDGPCSDPGRGNREGDAGGEVGWAGGSGVAAQFGPGVQWGERGLPLFFFFPVCSVFCFLFICLFSFLFYFI